MSEHGSRQDADEKAVEDSQDRQERRDGEEIRTFDRRPELLIRRLLEQQPEFLGFLRRRLGSEAVAEDLLQQSLVRAVERYHSLKSDESVVPWFYRILRHAVIDYYRSHDAETRRDDAYLRDLVQAGEDVYALPLARVMEVLHAPRTSLGWFDGRAVLDRRSHTLPLVDLRQWLDVTPAASTLLTIVVLQAGEARFGLVVDQVRGREEVVIKPLPKALRGLRGYAGATLIGDGRMALILDVDGLR